MMLDKLLKAMPVTVFLMVTGINFLLLFVSNEFLESWYFVLNEFFGNSLLFSVALLIICMRFNSHCYSYVSVMGLICMNLTNLSFALLPYEWLDYRHFIMLGSLIPFTVLILFLMIKRV
jgi:hypothetical protein